MILGEGLMLLVMVKYSYRAANAFLKCTLYTTLSARSLRPAVCFCVRSRSTGRLQRRVFFRRPAYLNVDSVT